MHHHDDEYRFLQGMESYELRLYLVQNDLRQARNELRIIQQQLEQLHRDENWFIRMAKMHLSDYNDYSIEGDWVAYEQYMELVKNVKAYRQWLRDEIPFATEQVRRYKKEWEQVNKMAELQRKLTQRQQKN